MKRPRWILTGTVLVLVVYGGSKMNWHVAVGAVLAASPAPLALAIAINLLSIVLRGVRWWIFLRRVGPVPLGLSIRGALVGSGFNNLLVANGGDATRALLVARATRISRTSVAATLALDRLFDPICFVALLFVATFYMPLPAPLAAARPVAGVALASVVVLLVFLVRASSISTNSHGDVLGWRARLREFRHVVAALSTTGRFTLAILVSGAVWTLQLVTFALAARSVGVALPFAGSIAALLLTNTGLVLRATPGNVGFFQFAYAVAAARFGVSADHAVASAILLQLIQIVPTTLLALGLAPGFSRPDATKP